MNNGVDLVLSKNKKKVWENFLGFHNQIFHFGLINKKMWIWMDFYRSPNQLG